MCCFAMIRHTNVGLVMLRLTNQVIKGVVTPSPPITTAWYYVNKATFTLAV